ncbi:hypothetical protein SH449x_005111 [Pirellulaceae bacterium SH449]
MNRKIPFTPFEELMVAQDSREYPCDIWVKLTLIGSLNRNIFERSVFRWLKLHPLLSSKVTRQRNGHQWHIHESVASVHWITESALTSSGWPEPKTLSLETGKALHLFVVETESIEGKASSTLFIQYHHAQADGLGIIRAIHELLLIYDAEFRGALHNPPERSIEDLFLRNRFGLSWGKIIRILPQQAIGLAGVRQFLLRHPVPIVPHERGSEKPEQVATESISLSESDIQRLKRHATWKRVSMNECLATGLFRGIAAFRGSRELQLDNDWIRAMIPVNMRTAHEMKTLSACNVVSAVFLDRTPVQIRDPDSLLQGIHAEMNLIKENKLALLFIFSIWLRKILSWGRHASKRVRRCETSFVFSNLGKVFAKSPLYSAKNHNSALMSGDIIVKDFEILAPLNPYMVAAFTFVQFGERGRLTLRYDDRILDRSEAQDLMQHVQRDLFRQINDQEATEC